ncbi:multidrug resistance protein, MATE family [Pseudomonas flavescens]|uniref:Multidrug resistance protein, MATE family n=1 Tax=Phytopseudomonas flavescens TaxID=29435 RepID=A0A1G8HVX2_9GAMM|nr:NorM family multidrug efflux MATE transporter [Pseudomonas flavescens]SDI10796.1 multidrug resistance protein, MATE family [Pseudomonas flavescens]
MDRHTLRLELIAILRLSGPLIAAQLAHVLMVFTDTLMMGLLGPQELAGGGLGAASYSFVSVFCVGVIAAVGSLAAIRHGAGDTAGVTRLLGTGLWLASALALGAGILLWNLAPALLWAGQSADNVDKAMTFLQALLFALPGYLTFMALRGFTAAIGRPGPVMAISLGGALANFVLNYVLIKGWFGLPALGLAGIGLVTALISTLMALLLAAHTLRHRAYAAYPWLQGLRRPAAAELRELLRLGLPIGGTYAVESALFAFAVLCMGALGSTQLAAHLIAIQSVYVAFMVPVGISYAVTFRIGQHYGAGRLLHARWAGRLGIAIGALCMLGFAGLFWLAPHWVVGLFIDRFDPAYAEVVSLAVSLLAIAAWFELFDGIQNIAMGAIRGLKAANITFFVGLGCYWLIGAPMAWLLTFHFAWGAHGVWWGLASGLACAAIALTLTFEVKAGRMLGEAAQPSRKPGSDSRPRLSRRSSSSRGTARLTR